MVNKYLLHELARQQGFHVVLISAESREQLLMGYGDRE